MKNTKTTTTINQRVVTDLKRDSEKFIIKCQTFGRGYNGGGSGGGGTSGGS